MNAFLFAVLGWVTGRPWLALLAFCALTALLSVNFNLAELYREARGEETPTPPWTGVAVERTLALVYRAFFAPQDRVVRALPELRLERVLRGVDDPAERSLAALEYHDRATLAVLANLGLSTQLFVLGACLVVGVPDLYLWLVLASVTLLPVLQLRRELVVRSRRAAQRDPLTVHGRRGIRAQVGDGLGDLLGGRKVEKSLSGDSSRISGVRIERTTMTFAVAPVPRKRCARASVHASAAAFAAA